MSSQVFPTLPGITFPIAREPIWETLAHEAISGKETRIAKRSAPRWRWTVAFDLLRADTTLHELQTLAGFFNSRQGMFDSFLYTDGDDNTVTGQALGTGDGTTVAFQLVRTFGGFVESILAPNVVSAVYLNGVVQSGGSYSVSTWGATTPGVVTFNSAPGNGVAITADFTYYFPVRFADDQIALSKFMFNSAGTSGMYDLKKLSFISLK